MTNLPPVQLSDEKLAEIAERCKGVTPGPWGEGDMWVFASPRSGNPSHALEHIFRNEEAQANVAHVARLDPQTVLALVTELQHSREAVAWREIDENTPRDGSRLLLAKIVGHPDHPTALWWATVGHWSSKWNNWNDGIEPAGLVTPTHWLPISAHGIGSASPASQPHPQG